MPAIRPFKDMVEQQAAALLGLKQESMGKTQARQNFLPLVEELGHSARAIEITDHEKPVAILIGYSHWAALISKLASLGQAKASPKFNLMGSVKIVGDLEEGSKQAAEKFRKAIRKSAESL